MPFFRPCEIITLENCGEGDPRSSVTILGTTCLIWCVKWKSCPFISSCPYWALPFVPSTHLKVLQLVRTHCCSGSGHSNFTDLIQCGKESKSYCKLVQVCICVYLSTPTHEWKVWQQRDSSLFVKVFEMFRMGEVWLWCIFPITVFESDGNNIRIAISSENVHMQESFQKWSWDLEIH